MTIFVSKRKLADATRTITAAEAEIKRLRQSLRFIWVCLTQDDDNSRALEVLDEALNGPRP